MDEEEGLPAVRFGIGFEPARDLAHEFLIILHVLEHLREYEFLEEGRASTCLDGHHTIEPKEMNGLANVDGSTFSPSSIRKFKHIDVAHKHFQVHKPMRVDVFLLGLRVGQRGDMCTRIFLRDISGLVPGVWIPTCAKYRHRDPQPQPRSKISMPSSSRAFLQ